MSRYFLSIQIYRDNESDNILILDSNIDKTFGFTLEDGTKQMADIMLTNLFTNDKWKQIKREIEKGT